MTNTDVLDRTFDALANEHRRSIVKLLTSGPLDTPALAPKFEFSKQGLNKHLLILEQSGLIARRLHGRVHELTLRPGSLDGVTEWTDEIRDGWEHNFDRLDQVLRGIGDA